MRFLTKLLPKGSGPKGFASSAAQTPAQQPDTSYLADLLQYPTSGFLSSFTVKFEDGREENIDVFGKWGRKRTPEDFQALIHPIIEKGGNCTLYKNIERHEGKPIAEPVANFSEGRRFEFKTVPDNPDKLDQLPAEPPDQDLAL